MMKPYEQTALSNRVTMLLKGYQIKPLKKNKPAPQQERQAEFERACGMIIPTLVDVDQEGLALARQVIRRWVGI